MTVKELWDLFSSPSPINEPRVAPEDFYILLSHATHKERVLLLTHPEYALSLPEEAVVMDFFARRLSHEPVALIVGHKEFYGRDFRVTKDTLIPRPETELIVECALEKIMAQTDKRIDYVDIGTGSGCIAISVAKTLFETHPPIFPHIYFFATDDSPRAIAIAKRNARTHNTEKEISFLCGDLLTPYSASHTKPRHHLIITANLPYLSQDLYDNAPVDVRDFEPKSALVSGRDGLSHYCRLLDSLAIDSFKKESIVLLLEISPEQASPLQAYIRALFPQAHLALHKDLAQKDRVLEVDFL